MRYFVMVWRAVHRILKWAAAAFGWFVIAVIIQAASFPINVQANAISTIVSGHHFDYVGWELNAIAAKTGEALWGVHSFLDESQRTEAVRSYFADVARAQTLERQIEAIYVDPAVSDPQTASADLRAERDALREDLRTRQPRVEASLEGQVAAVLVDEGFHVLGQLVPPIAMHFTQTPNVLIVSPRDSIRTEVSMTLDSLPVDEKAALEARIDAQENVSSLIIPIGGMALFPAMVQETSHLPWAVETFSHEWFHHYMFMYPLGWAYDFNEATTINETAADIFGKEIARRVLERYYPEFAVSSSGSDVVSAGGYMDSHLRLPSRLTANFLQTVEPFDFNIAMRETRVTVDRLLSEGKIDEAEAYMEERRALFYENGYAIRKLNQAYFAFYGDYQGGGFAGAGGEDPIGPAVRDIRAYSPTLHTFALTMREVTNREQLLQKAEQIRRKEA